MKLIHPALRPGATLLRSLHVTEQVSERKILEARILASDADPYGSAQERYIARASIFDRARSHLAP